MNILVILLFISYYTSQYQLFGAGTYGFTAIDLFIFLIFFLFIKYAFYDRMEFRIRWKPHLTCLLLIIGSVFLSGLTPLITGNSGVITQYFKSSIHFLQLGLFALLFSFVPVKAVTWTRVIQIWLVISLLINIFGIYQIFARAYDLPMAWIEYTNVSIVGREVDQLQDFQQISLHFESFYRATSIFSEPSALATYNLEILVFLLIPFARKKPPFIANKVLNTLITVFCILGLFFTFSLTGLAGALLILMFVLFFERSKRIILILTYIVLAFGLIIAADSIIEPYFNISVRDLFATRVSSIYSVAAEGKGQTITGESVFTRATDAELTIDMTQVNPVTGVGIGNLGKMSDGRVEFSDTSVLSVFAETGLVGGIFFCLFFVFLFFTTGRYLYRKKDYAHLDDELSRLSSVLFFQMLIQFIINFVSGNNFISFWCWLPMSLILSTVNMIEMQTEGYNHSIRFLSYPTKKILGYYLQNTYK